MSQPTNYIYLATGTGGTPTKYPTCLLDASVNLPPQDREAFIDIGDGHEAIVARVWMTSDQFNALGTPIKIGAVPVAIVMQGNAYPYPIGSATAPSNQTITTAEAFYIIGARVARVGIGKTVYEVRLATIQRWWDAVLYGGRWNILTPDGAAVSYSAHAYISYSSAYNALVSYADIWNDMCAFLTNTTNFGMSPGTPSLPFTPQEVGPGNFWCDATPMPFAIQRLLRPIGCHLVANPFGGTSLSFSVVEFNYASTTETTNLSALAGVASLDGYTPQFQSQTPLETTCPNGTTGGGTVNATIGCQAVGDFLGSETSAYNVTNVIGGSSVALNGLRSGFTLGALMATSATQYLTIPSGAQAERTTQWLARAKIPEQQYLFNGGYPIVPGQVVRRVRISMDLDGWFTTVWTHGRPDVQRENWYDEYRLMLAPYRPLFNSTGAVQFYSRDDGTVQADCQFPKVFYALPSTADTPSGQYVLEVTSPANSAETFGTVPTSSMNLNYYSNLGIVGINLDEFGTSGSHWLPTGPSGSPVFALQVGWTSDNPPRQACLILGGAPNTTIGTTAGGTTHWTRNTSTQGVQVQVCTGTLVGGSNQYNTFSFDASGKLISIT